MRHINAVNEGKSLRSKGENCLLTGDIAQAMQYFKDATACF